MLYIALGAFSFLLGYLHDLAEVRKRVIAKKILGPLSFILFVLSLVMLCTRSPRLILPEFVSIAAWPFFGIFALLFSYSVFLELQINRALAAGKEKKLVTTGTYALTRHPSALWSVLAIGFLVLASKSAYLLLAFPLWSVMELIWVWLQDRYILPSIYQDYIQYRIKTPMLIPTKESVKQCLATLHLAMNLHKIKGGNIR